MEAVLDSGADVDDVVGAALDAGLVEEGQEEALLVLLLLAVELVEELHELAHDCERLLEESQLAHLVVLLVELVVLLSIAREDLVHDPHHLVVHEQVLPDLQRTAQLLVRQQTVESLLVQPLATSAIT